jgi:hypothetical protein
MLVSIKGTSNFIGCLMQQMRSIQISLVLVGTRATNANNQISLVLKLVM